MSTVAVTQDWQQGLSASERELLREVALALRGIRYGSVVLTVHDGRIVELNKTERIRRSPA
ncbi:MAG TPA: YezD family protein [Candidatus Baltobacteraceae bacterium]|nr:YezD family protein [Candidatus Baltobacteraceae bacterium]